MHACVLSRSSPVRLLVTLWTVARQTPLSVGSSRREGWRWLPCPSPGDLPDPGVELASPTSPALSGGFFTTSDIVNSQRGAICRDSRDTRHSRCAFRLLAFLREVLSQDGMAPWREFYQILQSHFGFVVGLTFNFANE